MKKIISIIIVGILILSGLGVSASYIQISSFRKPTIFDEYDMVIIAPSQYPSTLQPLINHKNSRNILTIIKTTEDIYNEYNGRDAAEKIKYFIKDAIEEFGIRFVLLVGGASLIPCRYTHIYFEYDYQDEWVFPSDLYYADIYDEDLDFSSWDTNDNDVFAEYNWSGNYDELDLYPDVYLGRLACVNTYEVTTCVNKIITYETTEAYTQDWFTDIVVIGGDSLLGDEFHIDEGEYVNEQVINILDGFIPSRIWASNGMLNDASNIQNAINNGAGFVFFNGHGHTNIWATHPHENPIWIPPGSYTNNHLNSLSNGNELPIVISDACYHCQYNVASDCFGWTFVKNPDGGCIAFLGATDIDVSYGGVEIITKGIEKLCLDISTNYMEGDTTFGELWANGISTYINDNMDEIDYITVEEFQPFGDPSLAIAGESQPPQKPSTPYGEISGNINEEYTYTTSTTDPDSEDELYYLFDWGDGEFSGWIGPYEIGYTAEASYIWTEQGEYEIKVRAKDNHGVQSEWSDPLEVVMPVSRQEQSFVYGFPLLHKIFECFPNSFPILKFLLTK